MVERSESAAAGAVYAIRAIAPSLASDPSGARAVPRSLRSDFSHIVSLAESLISDLSCVLTIPKSLVSDPVGAGTLLGSLSSDPVGSRRRSTRVTIVTTAGGPWEDDVIWIVSGRDEGVIVGSMDEGIKPLVDYLVKLPGFNHGAMIDAMGSTSPQRFTVWEREPSSAERTP